MRSRLLIATLIWILFPLFANSQYYTFTENRQKAWQDPESLISEATRATVQLLQWAYHKTGRPLAVEKYNRQIHFGTWVIDPRPGDCYNTRARVLMRDSEVEVKYANNNPCRVDSGRWVDPYGGRAYTIATDIEIDHVVALKNAYDSGAWSWNSKLRCLFTNFSGYKNHLLSAASRENQQKADKAPDRWMPSDTRYACQHLQNWLMVKFTWNLNMSEVEASAIEGYIHRYNCPAQMFQPSVSLISQVRKAIQQDLKICK